MKSPIGLWVQGCCDQGLGVSGSSSSSASASVGLAGSDALQICQVIIISSTVFSKLAKEKDFSEQL